MASRGDFIGQAVLQLLGKHQAREAFLSLKEKSPAFLEIPELALLAKVIFELLRHETKTDRLEKLRALIINAAWQFEEKPFIDTDLIPYLTLYASSKINPTDATASVDSYEKLLHNITTSLSQRYPLPPLEPRKQEVDVNTSESSVLPALQPYLTDYRITLPAFHEAFVLPHFGIVDDIKWEKPKKLGPDELAYTFHINERTYILLFEDYIGLGQNADFILEKLKLQPSDYTFVEPIVTTSQPHCLVLKPPVPYQYQAGITGPFS